MIEGVQLSIIMALCFASFFLLNFALIAFYAKQRESRGWKLSYTLMALGFVLLLTLQPILMPWLGIHISARWGLWLQLTGIVLILGSLALQLWARVHLGHYYAERAEVQPNHQVVASGPYAYMRHPLFTSYFIFVVGLLLLAPSLLTLLLAIYTFWDFSQAAIRDEKVMADNLPEYTEYMARTPRFIPRAAKAWYDLIAHGSASR